MLLKTIQHGQICLYYLTYAYHLVQEEWRFFYQEMETLLTPFLIKLQEKKTTVERNLSLKKQTVLNTAYFSIWRPGLRGTHITCLLSTAFTLSSQPLKPSSSFYTRGVSRNTLIHFDFIFTWVTFQMRLHDTEQYQKDVQSFLPKFRFVCFFHEGPHQESSFQLS